MSLPTFPAGDPPARVPDLNEVRARVVYQDGLLSQVEDDLVGVVAARVASQEDILKSVYRTEIKGLQSRVSLQDARLAPVVRDLRNGIRSRIDASGAMLSRVVSQLPAPDRQLVTDATSTSPATAARGSPIFTLPDAPVSGAGLPVDSATVCGLLVLPDGLTVEEGTTQTAWTVPGPYGPVQGVTLTLPSGTQYHYRLNSAGCVAPTAPPIFVPPTVPPPPPPIGTPPPVVDPTVCSLPPNDVRTPRYVAWKWNVTYWFSIVCKVGCPVKVIDYVTVKKRPDNVEGALFGPFTEPYTEAYVQARISEQACEVVSVPPTAPPITVPPTVPGTPPPPPPTVPGVPPPPPPATVEKFPDSGCWGTTNVCDVVNKLTPPDPTGVYVAPSKRRSIAADVKTTTNWIGDVIGTGAGVVAWLGSGFDGVEYQAVKDEVSQQVVGEILGASVADKVTERLPNLCVPRPDVFAAAAGPLAAAGLAEKLSGVPATYLTQAYTYAIQASNPQYIPEQPAVDKQYLAGQISQEEWKCYTLAHGNHPQPWFRSVIADQTQPGMLDVLRLWTRGNITTKQLADTSRTLGVIDPDKLDQFKKLSRELPPPSDAIRFLLRDAFDPNKSGRAEMIKEFNEQVGLKELLAAVGIEKYVINDATGKPMELDLPFLYWLSSYDEISPTQSFECLHRFRPNRVKRYPIPDGKGGVVYPRVYTMADVNALLKEKDYNPKDRTELAASSYRLPGRIDLKNFYRRNAFGPALGKKGFDTSDKSHPKPTGVAEVELRERFMDLGVVQEDADLQAWDAAVAFDESRGRRNATRQLRAICAQFGQGMIGRQDAIAQSERLTGDRAEAERLVLLCEAEYAARDVSFALGGVRRKYLNGTYSREQARTALTKIGVRGERVAEFLRTWDYQREVKTREVTASQVLDWFRQRIITREAATERLVNLKYDAEDARRMVRVAELGELAKTQKEIERAASARRRQLEKNATAEQRRLKELNDAQARRFAKFLATRSEKNLKEWLTDGTIDPADVRATLILKSYTPDDAERWLIHNSPKE